MSWRLLGFGSALRRFAGLRLTFSLGLSVAVRLGLGIADRLGEHLEQLGPRLVAHRSPS